MMTQTQEIASAVAEQIAADRTSPAARTADMIDAFRQELASAQEARRRHVAETAVIKRRLAGALTRRLAELTDAERRETTTHESELVRHNEAMARIKGARADAMAKAGAATASAEQARSEQLAEIDRQIAMLDAAIGAGAKLVS